MVRLQVGINKLNPIALKKLSGFVIINHCYSVFLKPYSVNTSLLTNCIFLEFHSIND